MDRVKPKFFWIDDVRDAPSDTWIVCRTSDEAIEAVKTHGWPVYMSLDHDLGGDDTVMVFLKRLVNEVWDGDKRPPMWNAHSQNPEGVKNIKAFMTSWLKSFYMP
jgi:hypothetical protein